MKHFTVEYASVNNCFLGSRVVSAETLSDAQTMFFEWLKKQSVYGHMWRLDFAFTEHKTLEDEPDTNFL